VPGNPTHRGPDPRDDEAFGPESRPALRGAVADFSWLLGRGYAPVSALKLVGDRWCLTERQRQAVRRASCSDDARDRRIASQVEGSSLAGKNVLIDGFNVLTTIESALGGAVVLVCRDTAYRDIAGIHGTYRKVAETKPALEKLVTALATLRVCRCHWLFDRPVSNSGRVRSLVLSAAAEHGVNWIVELVDDPDPLLKTSLEVVATADSAILDTGLPWCNLARIAIEPTCRQASVVDLSG
jgi:hypothetical protein